MGVKFTLSYSPIVRTSDLPKLSEETKAQIAAAIQAKLTTAPELFGKPLRNTLKNYRALRVGAYRVIFRIEKQAVIVLAILHRSLVYKEIQKRKNRQII